MTLHWVHTSDVHGNLDALRGIEDYVNKLRTDNGSAHIILSDGGDVLQGHPCVYYHNYIDTRSPHILVETMNRMHYDCMAVGNHDIEAGHSVYDSVFPQFHFPVLCANVTKEGSNQPYFQPYYIIEKGGLRIAVLSLLTPDAEHWLSPSQYEGMTFGAPKESAKYWIAQIKQEVQYDLLVGLFHIGWEELEPLAENVQDFDLILYGHDHHQGIHTVGRTLCAAPSALGTSFVSLKINTETKEISAEVKANISSTKLSANSSPWERWGEASIGSIDADLNEFDSYFGPSSFLCLTHQLQLAATGAQVSLAAPISYDTFIPAGPLTNLDVFKLYDRDSQLYTMRFTLEEIKGILEYSYSLWTDVMTSPSDHALLLDYLLDNGTRLCLKNFTINFLTAYGLDYTVDLTKPYGHKVTFLSVSGKNSSLPYACTPPWGLQVAINSFHANGGGNILTRGTGLTYSQLRERIIKVEKNDLRRCLADELKKVGDYRLKDVSNWHFIPEDWAQEALARDREIISD